MLNLLFPRVCEGCGNVLSELEKEICVSCRHRIPLANLHNIDNNILKNKFYGRFPLEHAISLIQFQKGGLTQQLLHSMKYRGRKELSGFFGEWLGAEISQDPKFKEITLVIPVPLHKQKLKKRGYNQVEGFGKALAAALQVPYWDDILLKISKTGSQVFKTRILRFETEEVFITQNLEAITDHHILLIDDIVTTGATLEKCATKLLSGKNVKISVATIAIT